MFNAIEAINDIIDDINGESESKYDQVYEALCEAVDAGELTLEEAEVINDRAYDMYATEGYTGAITAGGAIGGAINYGLSGALDGLIVGAIANGVKGRGRAIKRLEKEVDALKAEVRAAELRKSEASEKDKIKIQKHIEMLRNQIDECEEGIKKIRKARVGSLKKGAGRGAAIGAGIGAAAGGFAGRKVGKVIDDELI